MATRCPSARCWASQTSSDAPEASVLLTWNLVTMAALVLLAAWQTIANVVND